jgi:hypothetical protein
MWNEVLWRMPPVLCACEVSPESRIMASINDVCPAIVFSGKLERRAGDFVYLQTVAGGQARAPPRMGWTACMCM